MSEVKCLKTINPINVALGGTMGAVIETHLEVTVIAVKHFSYGNSTLSLCFKIIPTVGNVTYRNIDKPLERSVRDAAINAFPKPHNSNEEDLHVYQAVLMDYNTVGSPFDLSVKNNFELVMKEV